MTTNTLTPVAGLHFHDGQDAGRVDVEVQVVPQLADHLGSPEDDVAVVERQRRFGEQRARVGERVDNAGQEHVAAIETIRDGRRPPAGARGSPETPP